MKFSAAILLLSLVQIATCNAQWTPKAVPVTLPQPAAAPAAPKAKTVKITPSNWWKGDKPTCDPWQFNSTLDPKPEPKAPEVKATK